MSSLCPLRRFQHFMFTLKAAALNGSRVAFHRESGSAETFRWALIPACCWSPVTKFLTSCESSRRGREPQVLPDVLGMRCIGVKAPCHGSVTFRIHSTTTTEGTQDGLEARGSSPGSCFFLCRVSASPWTWGQCPVSVWGGYANGPRLPSCTSALSFHSSARLKSSGLPLRAGDEPQNSLSEAGVAPHVPPS